MIKTKYGKVLITWNSVALRIIALTVKSTEIHIKIKGNAT